MYDENMEKFLFKMRIKKISLIMIRNLEEIKEIPAGGGGAKKQPAFSWVLQAHIQVYMRSTNWDLMGEKERMWDLDG